MHRRAGASHGAGLCDQFGGIEGSKDGYVYGLCEATGATVWSDQIAQAGQLDQAIVGSIGGYIASASLGVVDGKAALFFVAAWPLPFTNAGIFTKGDTNIASCPGAVLNKLPLLPACPDLSLLTHPSRLFGLAAVDAATGRVDWRTTALPTAAATTYTNGVVFSPQALAFGIVAYNANSGAPLWAFPIAPPRRREPTSRAVTAVPGAAATCHDPEPIRRASSISWKYRMAASASRSSPVASTQRSITAEIGGFQAAAGRQRRSGE